MASIQKQAAVDKLTESVEASHLDDLIEIYNELFPEEPTTEERATQNPAVIRREIIAHMTNGLEVEEILDLWNVIFPAHRDVWFDEDDGTIHFDENIEPAAIAD